MSIRSISEEERQVLRGVQQTTVSLGEWPAYGDILSKCDRHGIRNPDKCLHGLSDYFVQFETPLELSRLLQLRAPAWDLADPYSTLIHDGFVTAVRQCVERVRHEKPTPPRQPSELIVSARDLWEPNASRDLLSIGLLLEVHDFGELTWDRLDMKSPFKIKLNPLVVRQYTSVGWFADFVSICSDDEPPLQAAA